MCELDDNFMLSAFAVLYFCSSYFNDNQYPDEAKREEIANACNAVIQKPGRINTTPIKKMNACVNACYRGPRHY